jgi:hypothetical protein
MSGLSSEEKRARFQKALDRGGNTHTIDDVVAMVNTGHAMFWEKGDGVVVTELVTFPRLKVVRYWLVAGALDDVLALQNDIDTWARFNGCQMATASGRKGWGRAAASSGWKPDLITFYKDLLP